MGTLLSHQRGVRGEQIAKDYFEHRGFRIVGLREFNHRGRQVGEVDCVAVRGRNIHFIEVKTRSASRSAWASGLGAVDRFKQRKLVAAIRRYLYTHPQYEGFQLHLDVCVVELYLDNQPKSVTIISDAVADVTGE